jgi:hypothetical protein
MTIMEFNRIVMGAGRLLVDLPENRCGVPHASLRPAEEVAACSEKSVRKSDFLFLAEGKPPFPGFRAGERTGEAPMAKPAPVNFPLCQELDAQFRVGSTRNRQPCAPAHQFTSNARPEDAMANRNVREKLENDPNRDMSHVPGTYNPGNQAGKDVQGCGQRPADEPGGSFLGKGEAGKRPKINKQATPRSQKR